MFEWFQPFVTFITTDMSFGYGISFSFLDFWVVTAVMALLYKLVVYLFYGGE